MTSPPTTNKGPLAPVHRWILIGWAGLALVMTVVTLVAATGAESWEVLVAAAGLVLFAWALAVLAVVGLVARFAMSGHTARVWTVALGPPVLLLVAMFLTRG